MTLLQLLASADVAVIPMWVVTIVTSLVVGAIAFAVGWGASGARIKALEQQVQSLAAEIKDLRTLLHKVDREVAAIDAVTDASQRQSAVKAVKA